MKRAFSLLLALALVLSLAPAAFAAKIENPVTVTVTHHANNHKFTAYQIFDGEVTDDGIMSNISWGNGITDGEAFLAALKADPTIGASFAAATNADKVADVMAQASWGKDNLDIFAEIAGGFLKDGTDSSTITANGDKFNYTIESLDPGYYLVKDTTDKVDGEDFRTKFIIFLVDDSKVNTKGEYTTVKKDVGVSTTSPMDGGMTRAMEKTYYYFLTADLAGDLKDYDKYHLEFNDQMTAGITFLQIEKIEVLDEDKKPYFAMYENGAWVVEAAKADIMNVPASGAQGANLNIGWSDILAATAAAAAAANVENFVLKGTDYIYITYSTKLNQNAVIGIEGNPNEVYLIFSNSPSTDQTGESNHDEEIVFSFQLDIVKVDPVIKENDEDDIPLAGAKFVMYAMHSNSKDYIIVDENNKIKGYTPNKDDASELISDENGKINVQGLERTTHYILEETESPAGYNLLPDPIDILINATIDKASGKYTELSVTVDGVKKTIPAGEDFNAGRVTLTVNNEKGNTLPSTGGVGTTMFYIAGASLVAFAIVMLITKKRMASAE